MEQEGPAGHLETWGYVGTATSSDPRLEGVLTFRNENLVFDVEGSEVLTAARAVDCDADPGCEEDERGDVEGVIFFLASSIENDGGVWRQRPWVEVGFPGADFVGDYLEHRVEVYDGEEGYEGLVAVLMFDTRLGLSRHEFSGFIVDARVLPPTPENASAK